MEFPFFGIEIAIGIVKATYLFDPDSDPDFDLDYPNSLLDRFDLPNWVGVIPDSSG